MSRNDQSFITLLGFDVKSFFYICKKMSPIFHNYTPFTEGDFISQKFSYRGRKRVVKLEDCAALVLAWTRTRGSMNVLQLIFGMSMSNLNGYLRFGRRILVHVLSNDKFARIAIPTEEKIESYVSAISARHPALGNKRVWCSMDGLKLYLEEAPSFYVQRRFYNGWTHDHYVTSVFVFAPDGTIPISFFNVPGCVHDSQVAEWGCIYQKLEELWEKYKVRCVMDSAFGKIERHFIIKSSQDYMSSN